MNKTIKTISHGLMTLAVAGLGLALTPRVASADFLDFTVDETSVEGFGSSSLLVDKINGAYAEQIDLGAGTFEVSVYVNFTQYLANEGVNPVSSQLGVIGGDADEYGLYALVTAAGTFTGSGTEADPFLFSFTSANGEVWLDPDLDTTKALPGSGNAGDPIVLGGTGDDLLVMTASSLITSLSGGQLNTVTGGNYQLVFSDPTIVAPDGTAYWPDLPLFNLTAVNNGDFDDADVSDGVLSGDVSLTFQEQPAAVPEPATLTLFGLGLLSSGVAARRRRRNQKI